MGNVIAEETIKTAGKEDVIRVIPEKTELYADGEDVTFVLVKLTDHNGIVKLLEDRMVIVDVTGPAEIIAIGSREPITEEHPMEHWDFMFAQQEKKVKLLSQYLLRG